MQNRKSFVIGSSVAGGISPAVLKPLTAVLLAALASSTPALAQWSSSGSGAGSSVSTGNQYINLTYQGNNTNPPTTNSGTTLQFNALGGWGAGYINFFTWQSSPTNPVPSAQWSAIDNGNFSANQTLSTSSGGYQNTTLVPRLTINGGNSNGTSGFVGIGTTNPQHLLHVFGAIGATEVIVSSGGADYVFEPDYRLQPLGEVKRYIQQYHHLPGIPPASQVSEKGMSLGEMQTRLLAKVEELTLHMIRAEEENRELRARLTKVESTGARER